MADPSPDEDRIAQLETRVAALSEGGDPQQPLVRRLLKLMPWLMVSHILIGAPALLISLVVAYGTFVQAEATQKMQQAAAWPFVSYGTSNVDGKGARVISLSLANNGVGPALLGPLEIRYRGKPVRDPTDLLRQCCGLTEKSGISLATSPATDIVVPANDSTNFLRLAETPAHKELWNRFERERWKLEVRSCYCSIFDDCWVIEGPQSKPAAVKACPADWAQFRER